MIAAMLGFLLATPVVAQDASLIHSDEPLWAPGTPEVWPQHFVDRDSFGCSHRIQLGVWHYTAADADLGHQWYRFANYGVMHCWMNVAEAYEPGNFQGTRPGFLIQLGRVADKELWALQVGARPGSDYVLLARPAGPDRIERFDVLQHECPKGHTRGGRSLDILLTSYCSINTKSQLVALAREMAKRPILGTMTFEGELPDTQ